MVRLWGGLLLAGCSFSSPAIGNGGDGGVDPGDDAAGEAGVDAPPASCSGASYGAAPYTVCLPSAPISTVIFSTNGSETINTDACTSTIPGLGSGRKVAQAAAGAPMLCVLAADSISITGMLTIRAQGALPLALLADKDLTIGSSVTIDVSGASLGAAGNAQECMTVNGGSDSDGGGGGAGGSFQTQGGNGAAVSGAGAGGTAAAPATPGFLRGGCAGGAGGAQTGQSAGGLGGRGGGAVYLLARGRLRIDGRINASGGGGFATTQDGRGGGGGGGSGGMIALWGGMQIVTGAGTQVWANGGGGGGGSDGSGSNRGGNGGASTGPTVRGAGGAEGASGATAGGDGAINAEAGAKGDDKNVSKSGGGGGGGTGWIEHVGPGTTLTPGTFSPAPR